MKKIFAYLIFLCSFCIGESCHAQRTDVDTSEHLFLNIDNNAWQFDKIVDYYTSPTAEFIYKYERVYQHKIDETFSVDVDSSQYISTSNLFDYNTYEQLSNFHISTPDSLHFKKCLNKITLPKNRRIRLKTSSGDYCIVHAYKYLGITEQNKIVQGFHVYTNGQDNLKKEITWNNHFELKTLIIEKLYFQESKNEAHQVIDVNLIIEIF